MRWSAQAGLASEQGVELLEVAQGAVEVRKDGARNNRLRRAGACPGPRAA